MVLLFSAGLCYCVFHPDFSLSTFRLASLGGCMAAGWGQLFTFLCFMHHSAFQLKSQHSRYPLPVVLHLPLLCHSPCFPSLCCALCPPMLSAYSTEKAQDGDIQIIMFTLRLSSICCHAEKCSQTHCLCSFFAYLFVSSNKRTHAYTSTSLLTLSHILSLYSHLVFYLWSIVPI